jgi:hypothetical protein
LTFAKLWIGIAHGNYMTLMRFLFVVGFLGISFSGSTAKAGCNPWKSWCEGGYTRTEYTEVLLLTRKEGIAIADIKTYFRDGTGHIWRNVFHCDAKLWSAINPTTGSIFPPRPVLDGSVMEYNWALACRS